MNLPIQVNEISSSTDEHLPIDPDGPELEDLLITDEEFEEFTPEPSPEPSSDEEYIEDDSQESFDSRSDYDNVNQRNPRPDPDYVPE